MTANPPDAPPVELSIVIVAYKSRADLARCLPTIERQDVAFRYEIIVVDNYGGDGLADFLSADYPDIRLFKNPVNDGYAGGNNLGLRHVTGRWTLFLNPDTELWPGALAQLVTTARQRPNALITPKLLNPDGTINACGNLMHYTGITTCRGLNQPASTWTDCHAVPLLSGAAVLGATTVFRELDGFDATYFMYFEDTDLSLRARLAGYLLLCEAGAVIMHHYALGINPTKFYYLERNRLLTFLKVFSRPTLLRLLPALLLTELLTWAYSLRGWAYVKTRFQTYRWLWANRSVIRQQRRHIQAERRVSDAMLLADALVSLPFGQVTRGWAARTLDAGTRWLYATLKPKRLNRLTT